jgi:hypothetical protein
MRPIPLAAAGAQNAFEEDAMGEKIEHPTADAFEELRLRTLASEREIADRYRKFAAWFEARGMSDSGALCEALATIHRDCHARLAGAARALAAETAARPCGVDWEALIESGGGPGLALGVERRLCRAPPGG